MLPRWSSPALGESCPGKRLKNPLWGKKWQIHLRLFLFVKRDLEELITELGIVGSYLRMKELKSLTQECSRGLLSEFVQLFSALWTVYDVPSAFVEWCWVAAAPDSAVMYLLQSLRSMCVVLGFLDAVACSVLLAVVFKMCPLTLLSCRLA